jgi:hypothetical protein
LHLHEILRHVKLAYSTPMPLRILLLLSLITFSLWGMALWGYHHWAWQQSEKQNKQLTTHILNQFKRYETVLLGCKSLHIASENVTIGEWSQFIHGLEIPMNYKAVTDIAIIDFDNRPPMHSTENTSPDQWQAIVKKRFCFRHKGNNELIKFDTSDLIRHKLMEAASENMIICLPTLGAWMCSEQSTTLILPIYDRQYFDTPNSDRLSNLKGWIAMAIDLKTLLELNESYLIDGESLLLKYVDPEMVTQNHLLLDDH